MSIKLCLAILLEVSSTKMRSSPPLYLRFKARALRRGFGQDASVPEHRKVLRKLSLAVLLTRRDILKSLSKQKVYLLIY